MTNENPMEPTLFRSDVEKNINVNWGWFMSLGVVLMALGAIAIAVPAMATLAVELLIGWILIFGAVMHIIDAFWIHHLRQSIFELLLGILYLVIGILLLSHPLKGVLTLTLLLSIFFLAGGIFKVILALELRTVTNWGWMLASGILALVLGGLILKGLPSSAAWAIGLLLGIDLIVTGWSVFAIALAAHSIHPKEA
jgi:uncharacterized membrane protein HdeD (DUF308 family)